MPNYVTNVLKLDGAPERIRALRQTIMNDTLGIHHIDFQKIIPMPGHIFGGPVGTREREIYGKNNWYDWSIENWGTKRNAIANEEGRRTSRCASPDEAGGNIHDCQTSIMAKWRWR